MRLRPALAIARAGLIEFFRDKMALFWTFGFSILLLIMFVYIWAPGAGSLTAIDVALVDLDSTGYRYTFNSDYLAHLMGSIEFEGSKLFNVHRYTSPDEALERLRSGDVDAVIILRDGFARNFTLLKPLRIEIQILKAEPDRASYVRSLVSGFFDSLGSGMVNASLSYISSYIDSIPEEGRELIYFIARPLELDIEMVDPPRRLDTPALRGWMVIGIIGINILYSASISSASFIHTLRERGMLRRILATPISIWELLAGLTLSVLGTIAVVSIYIVLAGTLVFGARIRVEPLTHPEDLLIAPMLAVGTLFMIGIGFIVSIFAKTANGATNMASAIAWPLMFIAGIIFPKFLLPEPLQVFSEWFPLSMAIDVVRDIMIYGQPVGTETLLKIAIATASTTAVFIVGVALFRKQLSRIAESL